jgi:hypothetical protein
MISNEKNYLPLSLACEIVFGLRRATFSKILKRKNDLTRFYIDTYIN